ncbi:MAG TPA: ABC transporter permease [Streptosporangiaceae bacterium]
MSAQPGPVTAVTVASRAGSRRDARERPASWALLRAFAENRLALAGTVMLLLLVVFSFFGPHLYHTDQIHANLATADLRPGSPGHPLGTDNLGLDELGRLMQGGQASLEVGIAAALFATIFGALWGAVAAVAGGFADALMMRIVDALSSIPSLFILIFLAHVLTFSTPLLIIVIGYVAWLVPARLVRGEALTTISREYVRAVRMMGGGKVRMVVRHVIPNAVGTMAVNATFQVADAILAVAALGYLGIGVPPPQADWGTMLSNGISFVEVGYWWMIFPAGIAIVLTVLAFNFIGDGLRDAFSVRLKAR